MPIQKTISAMTTIVSRLDLTQVFCDVDDFYQDFEQNYRYQFKLSTQERHKPCRSRLCVSEVMTIAIAFHGSGYKTFKEFYTNEVLKHWQSDFPNLVSYNRFVELIPWSLMLLSCFLNTRRGQMTGIAFIDSTPIAVCHPCRARSHKVFGDLPQWGKNSVGWYYGFKLHLITNDRGELLAFKLTTANTDDRKPVPDLTQNLWGKLFGDKGYVSQSLFEQLYQQGLQLIARSRKNMKNRLLPLIDKILLRKRAIIESVNDQLKNICQIQHTRHRSVWNFLVNLLGGLVAYTYHPLKPSLDLEAKGLSALPSALF